jgi:hypothetical protein
MLATNSVGVIRAFEIRPFGALEMGCPESVLLLASNYSDFIALIACFLHSWNIRRTLSESLSQPTVST